MRLDDAAREVEVKSEPCRARSVEAAEEPGEQFRGDAWAGIAHYQHGPLTILTALGVDLQDDRDALGRVRVEADT